MTKINYQLENYKEVYDRAQERRQSRAFMVALSGATRLLYRPNTIYTDGAEEKIETARSLGKSVIYAITHHSTHDPNVAYAAARGQEALRGPAETMHALAKSTLADDDGGVSLARTLTMASGSILVYRRKDYPGADADLLEAAGNRMMEVAAGIIHRGEDLAVFPEGTCNTTDPRKVQMTNTGMAHIAHQARALELEDDPEGEQGFVFVPVGISYGVRALPDSRIREFLQTRHATVCFGDPIDSLQPIPFQTTRVVKMGMQTALTAAHEDYYERRGLVLPANGGLAATA